MMRYQAVARALMQGRQLRTSLMGEALFSDPAWDMMLALYDAEAEGEAVPMARLGSLAGITQGVAIRWLGILLEHGLVSHDWVAPDLRRGVVSLSAEGKRHVEQILDYFGTTPVLARTSSMAIDR